MKFGKIAKLGVLLSAPILCLSLLGGEAKAEKYIYGDLMEKQSVALEDLTDSIKEKYNVDDSGVYDVIDELGFIYYEGETLYFVIEDKNISPQYALRGNTIDISTLDLENDNVKIVTSKTIQPSELKNALEEIREWISTDPEVVNASSAIMPNKMTIEVEYNRLSENVIQKIKQKYAQIVEFKLLENEIINYETKWDARDKSRNGVKMNNHYTTTASAYQKMGLNFF